MRFRQVEAFRAAMMTGSVTGAANLLSIAQPSASRLIADLENAVGFPLFRRQGGRLAPTDEGLRFYKAVDRAFLGLETLERAAEQIREARTGQLTVCALPVLSSAVMPGAIKRFLARNPRVGISLEVLHPPEIQEMLQNRQADLAMSVRFAVVAGVRQEPLITVRFLCALPAGHPLAEKPAVSIHDFHDQDYVGLMPSVPLDWSRVDRLFEAAGVRPRRIVSTPHSHTAYALVAAGLGIALLEPFAAQTWTANGVVLRPLEVDLRFTYALCLPEAGSDSPLVQDFARCLRAQLRESPPALNGPDALIEPEAG
ncbi:LysR substrate-binding domain-containing protein [Arenibaculum pallidiluteum]|uniref:LysR substrate-binding domain-containing protein n=1 Tax=Arenibaculum pallidiluteum TaxID=2812559 RepID=UPI001A96F5FE|nr:LysR substrate-binding domain-containing protein [Arenibaculum pallidiluteum]